MGLAAALARAVIGCGTELPAPALTRYPELARARWRAGGLPVRVAGWCLGQRRVAAITLWRTVWLAPGLDPSDELLLHELRHVQQFQSSVTFPARYLWETLRRGYFANRFEADARAWARMRLQAGHPASCEGDV
jgi:hypothetical protein